MFTRNDYMSGKCSHREYYAQYVDEDVRSSVMMVMGIDKLIHAYRQNDDFYSIPLPHWDALGWAFRFHTIMKSRGDYPTLAGKVCILKEAARQIVEKILEIEHEENREGTA